MGNPNLDQYDWIIGDNDATSTPEDVTWETRQTKKVVNTSEKFMVRIRVDETGSYDTGSKYWQLYYNTSDDPSTASQVTTAANDAQVVDGQNLTHGDNTADLAALNDPTGSFSAGEYSEGDQFDKVEILNGNYTDFQACVQFNAGATPGTYYFFIRYDSDALNSHSAGGAQVELAAASSSSSSSSQSVTKTSSSSSSLSVTKTSSSTSVTKTSSSSSSLSVTKTSSSISVTKTSSSSSSSSESVTKTSSSTSVTKTSSSSSSESVTKTSSSSSSLSVTKTSSSTSVTKTSSSSSSLSVTKTSSSTSVTKTSSSTSVTKTSSSSSSESVTKTSSSSSSLSVTKTSSSISITKTSSSSSSLSVTKTSSSISVTKTSSSSSSESVTKTSSSSSSISVTKTSSSSSSLLVSQSSSSVSSSSLAKGDIVWGHHTEVDEEFHHSFSSDYSLGDGDIRLADDFERIELEVGESKEMDVPWYIGTGDVTIARDKYRTGTGTVSFQWKTGSTSAACIADEWNNYIGPFNSEGWILVKVGRS